MTEINNQAKNQKDELVFIKAVEQIAKDKDISSLFNNSKKAKQALANFGTSLKEKLAQTKAENLEQSKQEIKAQKAAAAEPEVDFKKAIEESLPQKQEKPKSESTGIDDASKNSQKFANTRPENKTNERTFERKQFTPDSRQNYDQQKQVYNNAERKPYTPGQRPQYDNQRPSYNNNQTGERRPYDPNRPTYNNQTGERRPYDPNRPAYNNQNKPYVPGERRPYDPNRPTYNNNTGERRPYDSNRPAYNNQNGGARPFTPGQRPAYNNGPRPYTPGTPRPPFAGAAGGAKTAKANLTSAASVFVNKERDFAGKKKGSFDKVGPEDRRINKKSLLRRGLIEEQGIEERMVMRKKQSKKVKDETPIVYVPTTHAIITTPNLTVKLLSEKIGKSATEIIKQFMNLGIMTTLNSTIDFAAAELVAGEFGITLELKIDKTYEEQLIDNAECDDKSLLCKRAPIVTVTGHVDHGKTSLLDYIRKTNVIGGEAGGITQHIGAYSITWKKEKITFIDTPGHAAFENMRERGSRMADIAILIVAADDGVKPQTVEAIKHIKNAKTPMIVAINKIDKPDSNLDRIKQQLSEHEVLPEEWGGDAILVPVSAKTGEGIDKLLEMILLLSEVQDLKANPKRAAIGTVLEAKLDKGFGPVANVIIQNGTLNIGDSVVSGIVSGRVRAMLDNNGKTIASAGPSMPISVLGFNNVPNVGDSIQVVDEKLIKNVIEERKNKLANAKIENGSAVTLDDFLNSSPVSKKVLNLIVKADVQGSVEALKQSLVQIENEEVSVEVIRGGVGNITETDVQLAAVSNATIIGFNIKPDNKAASLAEKENVQISLYKIIYEALDDITLAIKKMLTPKYAEKIIGHAEVRALFKVSSLGVIAGCRVIDGKIVRNGMVRIKRGTEQIFEGEIQTLKMQKDDAKEVKEGFECGIKIKDFNDILENDIIECLIKERIEF